jgi:5-amino-6-(5-phosphoribosylamino)uracil reductase
MSADGKISDASRSPILFGSPADKAHLEAQVALADGILGGAGTLRAGGSAMPVSNPELLQQREQQGKPAQPIQLICSRTGNIDPELRFFQQPILRWLLTTEKGAQNWRSQSPKSSPRK